MNQEIYNYLKQMPHFSFLRHDELAHIAKQSVSHRFEKGTFLAEKGMTRIEHLYVINSGQLSIYQDRQGREKLVGFIKATELFGGITLLMNGGISLYTVRVDEDTGVYLIPQAIFLDLCARHKAFYEYFVKNFSQHIADPSLTAFIASGQAKIFLSGIAPFSFLPEEALDRVANALSMVSHSKGTILFTQGITRVGYLYIMQKGTAERYYDQDGRKNMRDILTDGDIYGGISMLVNDGLAVRTLEVTEDAYFYLLPRDLFLELCDTHDAFSEFFTDTFGKRMLNRSYAAIIARTAAPQEEELQLFNQSVQQLYRAAPVFGTSETTIQQAARIMRSENSSYLIIAPSRKHAAGIVTDSDLARKVIASGYDINRCVVEIMSTPLRSISDQAMVFEAMMTMMQHGIKHLAVTDSNEQIVGVLTNRELLAAQGQSPVFILRQILRAESLDEIACQHQRVPNLVKGLISNGAKARNINRLITTVSDAVLRKVMRIVLEEMGPAPVDYVFMILGSEGRAEQTLKTDQDNAIIFEDVAREQLPEVTAYFLELGRRACSMLNTIGYAYCKGGVMAQNPKWCKPVREWKAYFMDWINTSEPEALLQASIFFDFRGGYGEMGLIEKLRRYLFQSIENWSGFLRFMTENALNFKPPLGFFRNFVVESKGEHRDAFDIKSAMMPIVDFARIYSLKHGIEATNTFDRLQQLLLKDILRQDEYEEMEKAYSFLMQLRLVRQVTSAVDQKGKPDNFINPKRLTRIEQTMLKEIFKRIEKFQAKMNFDFVGIA